MGHPNMRNWKAREETTSQSTVLLVVSGEAEAASVPQLSEYAPSAGKPKTLRLNATTPGGQSWKKVRFEKAVKPGQYTDVKILWHGQPLSGGIGELTVQ